MNVINRIILFFYALAFGAVSLLVIALYTRIFSDAQVWNEFLYLCSRWETLAVAIVVLICSLYLWLQSISSHSNEVTANEAVIVQGKMGQVRISLMALKNMADKIAVSTAGVRDVKVRIKMTKAATKDKTLIPSFKLRLVVSETYNIVTISDDIRYRLNDYLSKYIGIENTKIEIDVKSISDNPSEGKRHVV